MKRHCLVVIYILLASFLSIQADDYHIVILDNKDHPRYDDKFDAALNNSLAYINARVLRNTFVKLVVQKVTVDPRGIFENDFLFGPKQHILASASVFLLSHHISNICILGEMLRVPMVTLNYEPKLFCSYMFSMRPDPSIMNPALVAMVRELRPRVVSVIVEAGFGEVATGVMSHEQSLNEFSFQTIANVNFTNKASIVDALNELKESGATTVLLIIQPENAYKLMGMVKSQKILDTRTHKWIIPFLDTSSKNILQASEGFLTLSIPTDEHEFNRTRRAVAAMHVGRTGLKYDLNPLLHDALIAIAKATAKVSDRDKCEVITTTAQRFCPVRRPTRRPDCKELKDYLTEVNFEGLTGDVKFTETKFRRINILDANEITRSQRYKLGIWSVPCEAYKWNADSIFKKQQKRTSSCEKKEPNAPSRSYQPKRRRLKIVAKVEEPFIFYDSLLNTENKNDRFSGFCKDVLDKLAEDLHFQYDLYLVPDKEYGVKKNNATWTGMIGELMKKGADIAIGSLTVTSARENVVDFTSSFMDFTMAILMKKPKSHGHGNFVFLRPFTFGMWISILVATMAVAFMMFLIERFSPMGYRKLAQSSPDYSGSEFSLINSLWFATASLLQQGPDQTPRSIAGRALSTSFWFFVTVVMAAYIASMAGHFITAKAEASFTSLEDVVNDGGMLYSALKDGAAAKLLEKSTLPLHRKMRQSVFDNGGYQLSAKSALKSVRESDLAFIADQPVLEYVNNRQPCDTMLVKHVLEMSSYAFGLQLRSEWTNHLSVHLLHLKETGFIHGLRLKWWDEQKECKDTNQPINAPTPINFHDMAGICVILAVGVCLAFVLLLGEIKLKNTLNGCCSKGGSIPRKEQNMLKAPQITYLDYKANGDHYDTALTKIYGSKYDEKSTLTNSFEEGSKVYREAPESTL